jgi:hypothetical protein
MDMIEVLASIEHDRWSMWQKYLHGKCERRDDGSLVIPSGLAARWERQAETPYSELSDQEKESDRVQVYDYWSYVRAFFESRGADPSIE